ncbi:MAG: Ig-like domain-containing protein [Patescibacteria group bacterium]
MPRKYNPQRKRYPKKSQQDVKKLVTTLAILVVTSLLVLFVGIPAIAKMGGLISKFFQGDNAAIGIKKDTLAPQAPYVDSLPLGTNEPVIKVKGLAEPGSKVTLILNGERSKDVLADGEGSFEFEYVALKSGENTITVTATDDSNNESDPSSEMKITLKKDAPLLEVGAPLENQILSELDNPIKVSGKTDQHTKVYVNDTLAIVDGDGHFEKYLVLRDEGVNTIKLKAVDIAGNVLEKEIKIVFNRTD